MNPILNVFLISLLAGLGTGLGGLISILLKPGERAFGFLMGITAGVMISLSFLELVNKAWALQGFWTVTLGFSAGAMLMIWHQHYTAIGIILGAIFVFILSGIFGV